MTANFTFLLISRRLLLTQHQLWLLKKIKVTKQRFPNYTKDTWYISSLDTILAKQMSYFCYPRNAFHHFQPNVQSLEWHLPIIQIIFLLNSAVLVFQGFLRSDLSISSQNLWTSLGLLGSGTGDVLMQHNPPDSHGPVQLPVSQHSTAMAGANPLSAVSSSGFLTAETIP